MTPFPRSSAPPTLVCVLAAVSALGVTGCSTEGVAGRLAREPDAAPAASSSAPVGRDEALARELVDMGEEDQAERTGDPGLPPGTKLGPPQDYARTARLKEIVAEHGWPTVELVGVDAASAAWLVAQHADFDVVFQQEARDLLREAVQDGQADPTELAYLDDRVQVNLALPQTYGSQVRCQGGTPAPATPLVDPARVDDLRHEVGLGTLEAYYDELSMMCANEEMEGQIAP